jgi:hypothetical protein
MVGDVFGNQLQDFFGGNVFFHDDYLNIKPIPSENPP